MLTLKNFKDKISPLIIERGMEYWREGRIEKLREIEKGEWLALIAGTEVYKVKVSLDGEKIVKTRCNCPYDLGEFCKHQVAVFYSLKNGVPKKSQLSIKEEEKEEMFLEKNLESLSKEDLIKIIKKGIIEIDDFKELVVVDSFKGENFEDKNLVKSIIRLSLNRAKDRQGFIDYWEAEGAVEGTLRLLDKAELLENDNLRGAINIYQSIIKVLVPALEYSDDSNGFIGNCINASFENLKRAAKKVKEAGLRKELVNYCLKECQKEKYQDWEFPFEFLGISGFLIAESEKEKLFEVLNNPAERGQGEFISDFDRQQAAEIKLAVIKRLESEKEILDFLDRNLVCSNIRKYALEYYFSKNDLEKCKELAKEGIECSKEYRGLVIDFTEWLLRIARREKNSPEILNYAQSLFFQTADFSYYDLLKRQQGENEWPRCLKTIVAILKKNYSVDVLAKIYFKEKQWDDLLKIVQVNHRPYLIENYYQCLASRYPNELAEIYRQLIYKDMEQAGGRPTYQEKCRYLRKIKKLGAAEEASAIIEDLKVRYKNRRALIEELDKV